MIDLHCHILPGIDDGPRTMEDAVALARAAVAAGTRTMVATPHVSWDYPANTPLTIAEGVLEVNRALQAEDVPLQVVPGAEVALTRATDLPDADLERLRLGGGPWLLVECPFAASTAGFETALDHLSARGHRLLLAHPERIAGFQRDRDLLERLVARGAMCSITAGSLVGRFGAQVQRFSEELVGAGLVHNVASDAHSTERRPPGIAAELAAAGLGDQASWFAEEVPRALLAGTAPPPMPEMPAPRKAGGLGRLFRRAS